LKPFKSGLIYRIVNASHISKAICDKIENIFDFKAEPNPNSIEFSNFIETIAKMMIHSFISTTFELMDNIELILI